MLNNEKFLANSPQQVLKCNQKALVEQQEKFQKIQLELNSLQS